MRAATRYRPAGAHRRRSRTAGRNAQRAKRAAWPGQFIVVIAAAAFLHPSRLYNFKDRVVAPARKDHGVGGVAVRTSHRPPINPDEDVFNAVSI